MAGAIGAGSRTKLEETKSKKQIRQEEKRNNASRLTSTTVQGSKMEFSSTCPLSCRRNITFFCVYILHGFHNIFSDIFKNTLYK